MAQRLRDLRGRMDAPQRFEQLRIEALRTKAKAIDAGCPQSDQLFGSQRARISFQGDFSVFVKREGRAASMQQAFDLRNRQQAGRAAAKKDSARAPRASIIVPRLLTCQGDLGQQSAYIRFA